MNSLEKVGALEIIRTELNEAITHCDMVHPEDQMLSNKLNILYEIVLQMREVASQSALADKYWRGL